ncbi:hypothetical protein RhiJN_26324 [Ceratobasidium sp. AG-Ba]|nr:hypothetical protein RhiJN_26324 [Ceratobasidium sp. AG-Ba]
MPYQLTSLDNYRYTASLTPKSGQDWASVFLADNGERCGTLGLLNYDADGIEAQIFRGGSMMYPFSIWMDGGRQANGAPADSRTEKYDCWGWFELDCPSINESESYALATSVPNTTVYITFCPPDAPDISSISRNTATASQYHPGKFTQWIIGTSSFTPVSTFLKPLATHSAKLKQPALPGYTSPIAYTPAPTTLTNSLGMPTLTSTVNKAVFPASSVVTDSQGSAISTIVYNLTVPVLPSPTSSPGPVFRTTSWTTYMSVNGSTVPAVGGQIDVLTTVSETYVFEPNTIVPLRVYSSISAESTRSTHTSLPSNPASSVSDTGLAPRIKITIAVVGSLIGIALLSVLPWVVLVKHRRRKRRTPDYAECHSSMWGSRSSMGANSRGGSTLDLDREPQPRASFVEPWTEREQPPRINRKIQREMEQRGGGSIVASPSRGVDIANPSREHAYTGLRPSKSANRAQPEPQHEPPARSCPLPFVCLPQESADSSPPSDNVRPLSRSSPLAIPLPLQQRTPAAHSRHVGEQVRSPAIPPMYNEAWNIRRS